MRSAVAVIVALVLVGIDPARASGSCQPGGRPDAGDIDAVRVQRNTFPFLTGPQFRLDVHRTSRYDSVARRQVPDVSASLQTTSAVPVPRGSYRLDGDGGALLAKLAEELQSADFFTMRFTPTNQAYIDGPSDSVAVYRCGVQTVLTTSSGPFQWLNLSDANAHRFFALIDRVVTVISSEHWLRVPDPTASPTP